MAANCQYPVRLTGFVGKATESEWPGRRKGKIQISPGGGAADVATTNECGGLALARM